MRDGRDANGPGGGLEIVDGPARLREERGGYGEGYGGKRSGAHTAVYCSEFGAAVGRECEITRVILRDYTRDIKKKVVLFEATLAQLVERLIRNQQVASSISRVAPSFLQDADILRKTRIQLDSQSRQFAFAPESGIFFSS